MKVALVTLQSINNSFGGSTKVFFNMANNLAQRGFTVTGIASDSHEGQPAFQFSNNVTLLNYPDTFFDQYVIDPITRFAAACIADRHKRRVFRQKNELKIKAAKIKQALKESQPEVIVSFQQETTYLLLDILHVKVPVITMVHRDPEEYFSKPEFDLYKSALNRCAYVQVLLPNFIDTAAKFINKDKLVFIPNVVPQYTDSADLDAPLIINISRISTTKRQHLLVEAFDLIKERHPDWNVECWGFNQSEYGKRLKKEIEKRNLQSRVELCGETTDVVSKLKHSSIFVFPSEIEGFSLALTEAMSMGLAVVGCSDCPSVYATIEDNVNGLLANATPNDIAQKIELLISDRELRHQLGANAKKSMEIYSPNNVWDKWTTLISKAGKI